MEKLRPRRLSLGKAAGLETAWWVHREQKLLCTAPIMARNGRLVVGKFEMGMAAEAAVGTVGMWESSCRLLDFHIPTVLS
jgi:hypothetical protein